VTHCYIRFVYENYTMVQNTLQRQSSFEALMKEDTSLSDLTPTTLKTITQIFESSDALDKIHTIENDGFLAPEPPMVKSEKNKRRNLIKLESTSLQGGTVIVHTPTKSENLTILDPPMKSTQPTKTMQTRSSNRIRTPTAIVQPQMIRKQATVKRTPQKCRPGVKANHDESDLSPDEVERLRIRRERNKAAAARCRKRRMDTISTLEEEVQQHEDKKRILEETIAELRAEKMQLEYILSQHQAECKFNNMPNATTTSLPMAVKSEPVLVESIEFVGPMDSFVQEPNLGRLHGLKPKRPLTLTIAQPPTTSSVEGVMIETPSNVVTSLGFENLLTSTGLTPTTNIITPISFTTSSAPSCSSQQRTCELSLTDLNTPSNETMSLVSL